MSRPFLIAIAAAYLLGSIPFGYILILLFKKQDVRASGSGNIGATNVARTGGKWLGIATLLLDLGKAFAGVALAQHLIAPGNYEVAAAAAVAAICGHVFPVWLSFRGGKGVASALGVFLALTWPSALCVLGVFIGVLLLSRYVSLASVLAAAAFPLFAFHFVPEHGPVATFCFLFVPSLIIIKHHANIRRLLSGTENRFGKKKAAA